MKEKGEEEKRARAVKAVTVPRIQTVAPSRDTEAGKFIDPKPVLTSVGISRAGVLPRRMFLGEDGKSLSVGSAWAQHPAGDGDEAATDVPCPGVWETRP